MSAFATTTAASDTGYDGRHARRDRNREAVIAAVADYLADGEIQPTAQMIAERSGVSLRSVFRYFDDLDELLVAGIEHFAGRHAQLVHFEPPPPGTPLDDRIERWISFRLDSCAVSARSLVAGYARARQNERVFAALERFRTLAVDQIAALFEPELAALPDTERRVVLAALHSCTLAETWVNLVDRHGLDTARQRIALRRLIRGALEGAT